MLQHLLEIKLFRQQFDYSSLMPKLCTQIHTSDFWFQLCVFLTWMTLYPLLRAIFAFYPSKNFLENDWIDLGNHGF